MDLGQTLQIIANIGVLVGLVFLAMELSQNTDAMRSHRNEAEISAKSDRLLGLKNPPG